MELICKLFVLIVLSSNQIIGSEAQVRTDRICATSRFDYQCNQLQRGSSPVSCQLVQDSIECAHRLRNGTADFGVFSAETALLLATLKHDGLSVIKELRHSDRLTHKADFESVVVVRADHTNGIDGLKGLNYCHPGFYYDRYEKWSERFRKHFERSIVPVDCDSGNSSTTPAALEVSALSKFFKSACRPGAWSNNPEEDAKLKAKYPNLCELCTSHEQTCEYKNKNGHGEALECLINKGQVAYVSAQIAQSFFAPTSEHSSLAEDFAYLCPNGTLQSVSNRAAGPCTWIRQPWPVILSSDVRNIELSSKVKQWSQGSSTWETAFREIITADSFLLHDTTIQKPRDYFREYREVPYSQTLCATQSTWCTTSIEEKEKCEVIRAAGITSGIYPLVECRDPAPNTVTCLNDVSKGRADFVGIDSNYGFIARHPYNLQTALYAETENAKYASVVVVVHANSSYERFENLRDAKACFAEFGSISAMAFINTGKNRGFFRKNQCKYGKLLSEFFGPSCAPGALDLAHNNEGQLDKLCSLCRPSVQISLETIESADIPSGPPTPPTITSRTTKELNCNADPSNGYYGNQGALNCLREDGDVAVLEVQYLREHANALQIDPNDYRIICANGSIAQYSGFDVDDDCALTTIVDGEIVVSKQNPKIDGIINALISFDKYFQHDPDFKMFNAFGGKTDLLFKDSTLGLAPRNEQNPGASVENYKKLFQNLDDCVNMGTTASVSIVAIVAATLISFLMARI